MIPSEPPKKKKINASTYASFKIKILLKKKKKQSTGMFNQYTFLIPFTKKE